MNLKTLRDKIAITPINPQIASDLTLYEPQELFPSLIMLKFLPAQRDIPQNMSIEECAQANLAALKAIKGLTIESEDNIRKSVIVRGTVEAIITALTSDHCHGAHYTRVIHQSLAPSR